MFLKSCTGESVMQPGLRRTHALVKGGSLGKGAQRRSQPGDQHIVQTLPERTWEVVADGTRVPEWPRRYSRHHLRPAGDPALLCLCFVEIVFSPSCSL